MGIKVIIMLKRKAGMTPEAFRHEYENGHSRLGLKYMGHLWSSYKRNYLGPANSFAAGSIPTEGGAETNAGYDVITEIIYKDMAAVEESNRIASDPEFKRLIQEDEARLFDRVNCLIMPCEVVGEDDLDYDWKDWKRDDPTYKAPRRKAR